MCSAQITAHPLGSDIPQSKPLEVEIPAEVKNSCSHTSKDRQLIILPPPPKQLGLLGDSSS